MRRNPRQEEEPEASAAGPGPGPGRRSRTPRCGPLRRPALETEQRDRRRRQCHPLRERPVQRAEGREGSRIARPPRQQPRRRSGRSPRRRGNESRGRRQAQAAAGEGKPAEPPAVADALKELREEVTKLKKAKAEIKKPENDVFMKFGYGGTGSDNSIPVVQLSDRGLPIGCSSRRSAKRSPNSKRPSIRT